MDYLNKTKEELICELRDQKKELDSLKLLATKEMDDRSQIEYVLNERLKELRCHDLLSEVMSNSELSVDEVWEKIVQIIPPAWQFPEIAEASIQIPNHVFTTPGYMPGKYSMIQDIKINQAIWGQIEVCYPVDQIPATDQLFLPEESSLLFSIAVKLGNYIEKKEKEQALKVSEEKYKDLIENISDVIYTTDNQGNITFISPFITTLLGYKPEDIIGKNFTNFTGETSEHLKKRFEEIKDKTELQSEYQILSVTGEPHWIRFSTKALIKEGQFIGVTGTLIDITEKRRIELELQKSESLYRSILNASPDTIFIADLDGNVLFTSPMALKMFGYEKTGFPINSPLFNFVDPKDHDKARDAIRQMFEGKYTGATEYMGIKSDGTTFDMEVNGEFIRDEGGKPTSMVFITRDISDRKAAEKKLRKSEDNYRRLVESIKDIVFEVTIDGTIKYVSPSIEKLFNLKPENLIGQKFFSFVHPDDLLFLIDVFKNNRFNEHKNIEYRCLSQTGEIIWVQVSAQNLYEEGILVGRTGILHDITERKLAEEKLRKSEEQYRKLVESVNDVIYEVDTVGKIKFASPSVNKVLGFTSEEVVGRNIFEFVYPEDIPGIMETLKSLPDRDYNFLEYRYMRKDGSINWVRSSTSAIIENGVMVGGTGILTDITERKLAEETLKDKTNLLTNLIINLQEGILLEDSNRNIALTNQLFCNMFGIPAPPEALVGADCTTSAEDSKIFFKNPEKFIADIERILENKEAVFNDELELLDGRYLERDYIPTYIENTYNGHLWKYRDITERKLAEEKVRESEERFRLVFENVFDGISIFEESPDPQNRRLIECNEQYAAMAGRSRDELLKLEQTYSLTTTLDENANEMRLHSISEKNAYHGSFKWIRPDGKDNTIEYIAMPVTWKGKSFSIGIDRDITEHKLQEDRLRKLSRAVEQSPVSIVITNLDGDIEYANPKAIETTGYSLEELQRKNPRVLKSGETTSDEYQHLWESITHRNYWSGIFHNKRKNGELYWEASQITPITDENGNITSYLALKEDITERKKVQEELAKSEDRFREITEQSQNVIWETDSEAVYTFVSQVSEIAWGLKPSDLIGKKRFFDIHPEEGKKEFIDACLQQIQKGEQFRNLESLVQGDDGKMNWVMTNGMPYLDSEGNVKGYRGSSLNINQQKSAFEELRQSEERYKSIFRNNHSVMMIIDPETGDFKDVNDSACKYYGWSYDEMCSKNISEINVLTRKHATEEMRKAKEDNRNHFFFKHRLSNGEIRDVEVYSCPIRFGDSTLLYSIVHDISDRIVAEESLKNSEAALNQAQEISKMCSWELNLINEKLTWSKNYYHLMGISAGSEMKTEFFLKRVHPQDLHLVNEKLEEMKALKKPVIYDIRLRMPDNEYRWIQNNIVPEFEDDKLIRFKGVNIDVTEKKLAEENIRQQNERLSAIIGAIPDLILIVDLNGTCLESYSSTPNMSGVPNDQNVGANIKDIFNEEIALLYIKKVEECLQQQRLITYDFSGNQNNSIKSFEVRLAPMGTERVLTFVRDISDEKLKDKEIKKLSLAVEQSPVIIVITDLSGNIEYVNPAFYAITGYAFDEVLGQNTRILKSGETDPKVYKDLWATISEGDDWYGEWINKKKNGKLYWESVSITPIRDDNGKITNYLAIKQDITQRKQTEDILKQNEEKYRFMFMNNPQPMWIYDLETLHFLEVNSAAIDHYGYSRDEFLSMTLKDIRPQADIAALLEDVNRPTRDLSSAQEWRHLKKNGEIIAVEIGSHSIIYNDINARHVIVNDITRRKQIEEEISNLNANLEITIVERTSELSLANYYLKDEIEERKRIEVALSESEKSYRTVVENVNEVIFQTDPEGLWVFLNKSWEDITGFSVEESMGQLFVDYVHPDDRARNWELFEPLILREKDHCRHEIRYLTKDGGFRWVEVFARLGLNENDEITGTYGTLQDITVRRQAEAALRDSEIKHISMIANISDVIGIIGVDGVMKYKSPNITRYFGWQPEDLVGSMSWLTVHPDDVERIQKAFYEVVQKDNATTTVEYQYLCKDGSYKPIELTATNLINNQIINGMLINYHDITARKLAEEALAQLSSRLSLALRVGGIGVWDYDVVNNVLFWDNQMFAIYGIREEDFSSAYDAWLNGLHPDDRIRGDEEIQMAIRGEKEFDTEFRVVWPDGSVHFVRALAAVERDNFGRALRLIGTNWDITIQKQAANFENEMLQLSTKLTGVTIYEIDSALKLALLRIGQFLNADRAYIFEFNDSTGTMHNTHEWCNEGIHPEIENLQEIPCDLLPNWMETLHAHQNIIIPSVQDLPKSWQGEREILEPQGIQSLVVIPLLVENNLIGFVGLDSVKSKRDYNSTEMNILKVWSSMLASLIQNKRTEGLLEQTRQNYETFFNTIDDFLWVLDQQGNIIHTNKTVKTRLEYSEDELYNESVLTVHPTERRAEAGRIVGEMLAGISEFCPVPIVTKSGKKIPVETRVKSGFWNGLPVIFGVSKDISQIQLSEQKFSSAFQSNSAIMAISNFDTGEYIDINNAFQDILGFSREEILGKTNQEMGLFVDSNLRHEIISKLLQNISVRRMEVLLRTKDGSQRIGLLSADSIYVGETRCLLTVNMDITERKIMEDELRKARMEAEQANLAKSEFLSRMSHELRTPMNSILGFAQLFEMGELNPGQRKGVNHIMKSGRHLLDLINEVLDISRIEAGRLSLSIEPVKLNGVIAEMVDVVKPLAHARQIKIDLANSLSNHWHVKSDRQRMRQVLLNLLNNAIKYNKEAGTVLIKTELMPPNTDGIVPVRISISDTGLGIAAEDILKLFMPFERIGADKTLTEGTGLGLAVVKKLVDAMEGKLGVESIPGEGSTFWVELPQCKSQLENIQKTGKLDKLELTQHDKTGTILYIEDNTSNIELVEQILSSQRPGIHLTTNIYGKNTVDLAIDYQPDLILLDLNLPDIHGSEVLQLLLANEQTKNIPVVVISADAMPQQMNRLLKAGAMNYLTKPLDLIDFLKIVDGFIKG